MGTRDSQRAKLYAAERDAFGFTDRPPDFGRRFADLNEVDAYLRKLFTSTWWWRRWPEVRAVTLRPGHGARNAFASWYERSITLPRWARREDVVLHELSHVVTGVCVRRRTEGVAAHGWQFCEIYLELVRHQLGPEAHQALRAAFRSHGVRYHKPRQGKPLSPERRERLVLQLAAAREARCT